MRSIRLERQDLFTLMVNTILRSQHIVPLIPVIPAVRMPSDSLLLAGVDGPGTSSEMLITPDT